MKKTFLSIALAFAASISLASTPVNDKSNLGSSDESETVSVNDTKSRADWLGTYTFKTQDGKNIKIVLKDDYDRCTLFVNGKETDYGTWSVAYGGQYVRVYFDTRIYVPGQSSLASWVEISKDGYVYSAYGAESGHPKKRVKYTKTK